MQSKTKTGNNTQSLDSFFRTNPTSAAWNTEAGQMGGCSSMSTTDLTIIQDEMYKEALLYKKCSTYAGYFTDANLKGMAQAAAEHHRKHFDTLHGYLNGVN